LPFHVDRVRADNDARNETLDHLAIRQISFAFRTGMRSRASRLYDELPRH
jgi:hypothetical protein